ncbi:hypothetical protein KL86PLE_90539 [uncultured Pleomorphomonas sp.]|uniref:Uncharacterized protein n=1 Tax=uncultured Pleomorphomonas sp. TaxID=442121 RepID=A0A212LPS9_9HYPH|nr:hypothetical protein KL86PLE_90539 [uncultured Pleomorphomonas sp.]
MANVPGAVGCGRAMSAAGSCLERYIGRVLHPARGPTPSRRMTELYIGNIWIGCHPARGSRAGRGAGRIWGSAPPCVSYAGRAAASPHRHEPAVAVERAAEEGGAAAIAELAFHRVAGAPADDVVGGDVRRPQAEALRRLVAADGGQLARGRVAGAARRFGADVLHLADAVAGASRGGGHGEPAAGADGDGNGDVAGPGLVGPVVEALQPGRLAVDEHPSAVVGPDIDASRTGGAEGRHLGLGRRGQPEGGQHQRGGGVDGPPAGLVGGNPGFAVVRHGRASLVHGGAPVVSRHSGNTEAWEGGALELARDILLIALSGPRSCAFAQDDNL